MGVVLGYDTEVIALIAAWAENIGYPFDLAMAICVGESGLDVNRAGDNGLSWGLIQVHLPAHGHDAAYWTGLEGARRSLELMKGRWQQAFAQQGGERWPQLSLDEKVSAFESFWPAAQGCQPPGRQLCEAAVTEAQRICQAYLAGNGSGGGAIMVAQPALTWVGADSENFARGRRAPSGLLIAPEAWVNHIAVGTFEGVRSWFNTPPALRRDANGNPIGPSSTHFSVAKDGRAQQHVALDDTAFGNGDVQAGYTSELVRENAGLNPNLWTVSCEHEGVSGEIPTDAMFDTSTRLCAWVFATRLIPGGASGVAVDRRHILRHGDISPVDRRFCPGWPETVLADYVARVAELVSGRAPVELAAERELSDPFSAFLSANPDAGRPRHGEVYDLFGNAYLWLAACERYPHGALLYWRKWMDRTQLVSWEDKPSQPIPGSIADYLAAHPQVGSPRHEEQEDIFRNRYVWLTACPRFPHGALLVWRRWMDAVQLISWEAV